MNLQKIKLLFKILPDKLYIKMYYRLRLHKKLGDDFLTLNQKIQWLKFNDRNPVKTIVSDKYLVRNYVENKIGGSYLIPMLGVWNAFSDIDFDKLPNEFVLKCNHDSGGIVICKNKNNLDFKKARKKINSSLKNDFYYVGRENQYKNIRHKIIAEQFISDNGKIPFDYKIFCFNGKPDLIMVCYDRFSDQKDNKAKYAYFNFDWEFIPFDTKITENEAMKIKKPSKLKEMFSVAEKLSHDFIFARIDLYYINDKIYFGEITLTPNAGFDSTITPEADLYFGNKLLIPYWDEINHKL